VDVARAQVGEILRGQQGELLRRWIEAYAASPLRVPRPIHLAEMARLVSPILESLADALGPAGRSAGSPMPSAALIAGSTTAREIEKASALVGALLASEEVASGFDVTALFFSLRDVFAGPPFAAEDRVHLARFAEWLTSVAFDSFSAARVHAERERAREHLEDGTPVVLLSTELPAAFLVGRPDGRLIDSVLSRLLLMVVRVGARAVLVHAGGLVDPARPEVLEALHRFAAHKKVAGTVEIIAVALEPEAEPPWREVASDTGATVTFEEHLDRAVERGLAAGGVRLLRT
jgi:hypothetical protein